MTKFFNKLKKTLFLSRFWTIFPFLGAKKIILENLPQLGKTSYEFLAPHQNLEKSNNIIPKKMHRQTEG